jgi:hypothetical protein
MLGKNRITLATAVLAFSLALSSGVASAAPSGSRLRIDHPRAETFAALVEGWMAWLGIRIPASRASERTPPTTSALTAAPQAIGCGIDPNGSDSCGTASTGNPVVPPIPPAPGNP